MSDTLLGSKSVISENHTTTSSSEAANMSMRTTKLQMASTTRVDPRNSLLFNLNVASLVKNAFRPKNSVGPKMLGLKKLKRAVSQDDLIKNGTIHTYGSL